MEELNHIRTTTTEAMVDLSDRPPFIVALNTAVGLIAVMAIGVEVLIDIRGDMDRIEGHLAEHVRAS